jgi:5-methylcytosine-specific restriction endonuclease McrA
MNLKNLSDDKLLNDTKELVAQESQLLTKILHHLREIERRRLFCTLQCGSLFEYAVKHLKYSEDQAYRRIQAMRVLKELPEIEAKITSGELNLTHLGLAQTLFKKESQLNSGGLEKTEKLDLLMKLQRTTKREAQKIVIERASEPNAFIPKDSVRPIGGGKVLVQFTVSEEDFEKIEKLKGWLAHKLAGNGGEVSISQVVTQLVTEEIKRLEKVRGITSAPARETVAPARVRVAPARAKAVNSAGEKITKDAVIKTNMAETRREVWRRAAGRCENCQSQFALEMDHIRPKALGGSDCLRNLRLLCRSCNQRAAIEELGQQKMENYFNKEMDLHQERKV